MAEPDVKTKQTRFITGFAIALIVICCMLLGGKFLLAFYLTFVLIGMKEYTNILKNKGFLPFYKVMVIVSLLLIVATATNNNILIPLILIFGTMISFFAVLFRGRQPYIANVATTILGFIIGWLPCYIVQIRGLGSDVSLFGITFKQGLYFILFLFFVIMMTDIAAYFFGTRFGRHKLSPVISPKKTIEGSVAGTVFALITGLIIGKLMGISVYHSFVLSMIITVFAQLGDLSESLIKRDAGVKDSGHSLPGHGGFLDRADSYLFSVPAAYFYIKYFILSGLTFPMLKEIGENILHVICG